MSCKEVNECTRIDHKHKHAEAVDSNLLSEETKTRSERRDSLKEQFLFFSARDKR